MILSYTQILAELAPHLAIPEQQLLEQQQATFEHISVFFQPDGHEDQHHIVLCSVLGKIEGPNASDVMRTLLQANHLWTGTAGGVLGLSAQGDTVTWCIQIPLLELNGQKLFELLSEFVELGSAWAEYLRLQATPAASEAPSERLDLFMRA